MIFKTTTERNEMRHDLKLFAYLGEIRGTRILWSLSFTMRLLQCQSLKVDNYGSVDQRLKYGLYVNENNSIFGETSIYHSILL